MFLRWFSNPTNPKCQFSASQCWQGERDERHYQSDPSSQPRSNEGKNCNSALHPKPSVVNVQHDRSILSSFEDKRPPSCDGRNAREYYRGDRDYPKAMLSPIPLLLLDSSAQLIIGDFNLIHRLSARLVNAGACRHTKIPGFPQKIVTSVMRALLG